MFYDDLSPFYHLLYEDWDGAIGRQSAALDEIVVHRWGRSDGLMLDVAAGIGTQALGFTARGYHVLASDLSAAAVRRACRESVSRGLRLSCVAADFSLLPYRSQAASLLISADNSLPHLLTDEDILAALREYYRCLRPGGGMLLTLRDYGPPPPTGTVETRPYGWRQWGDTQYFVSQEWRWEGTQYELRITAAPEPGAPPVHTFAGRYYAIRVPALLQLCASVGFIDLERRDGSFYQPVILGTRPAVA
jgi:SAM-dependent methyltransferase